MSMVFAEIKPDDLFVVVMGTTGAGKSTFIERCTKDPRCIEGHGLISCTSNVSIHTTEVMGRTVHLIDTPGFDDSRRSEIDTLQELAYWLAEAYERKVQLSGIVYLHRITDTRLQGSAMRTLKVFKKICGEDSFHGVVLATTMWTDLHPEELVRATERHEEFRTKACRDILGRGGKVVALSAMDLDGTRILQHIVQKDQQLTLALQEELMVEKKTLHDTGAGKVLLGESIQYRESMTTLADQSRKSIAECFDAAHAVSAHEASWIMTEMSCSSLSLNASIKQARLTVDDIRKSWEEKLSCEDTALDEALELNTTRLKSNGVRFEVEHEINAIPKPIFVGNSDTAETIYERQILAKIAAQRVTRRHTARKRISPRVGIIGTGLAVGQLVATLACTVM